MHPLVFLLLIVCSTCSARYRESYDTRNLIEREEPLAVDDGDIVECPVCEESRWMPSNEECPIVKDNKRYKKCELGTYTNEVCGNRRDCYRGPGEQCTVKRQFDMYGQKCAAGYYCNKPLGICQGLDYVVDTKVQYILNPTPYSLRRRVLKDAIVENSKFDYEGIRN